MELVKEITVFLENHPGIMARVVGTLAERNVNIRGFTLNNYLDHGALRLIVDDPTSALHVLGEHNLLAIENYLITLQLKNEPGALTRLAEALAEAEINIEYAYGSAGALTDELATLYIRVSDDEKAMEVFRKLGGTA